MARLRVRIDFDGARQLGPGKIRLLELIAEHGSISAASRLMGMSYRRAWSLAVNLNEIFAEPLIIARTGGSGGGSAELTAKGQEVVRCYRAIEADAATAASCDLRTLQQSLAIRAPNQAD
ncbi:MAG: winged helix-turn-helix domain-containing protein [Acetobacteraceae bacterium]|nr:winged helix-turn-helix domain-containing protein [Acetobacteraceae bacterium]